jgi:dienelactone hydrolase
LLGAGTIGVVLSNQNDNDVCPWLPFARTLRDDGYRVLLYRYGRGGASPSADLAAAVDALRAQGVERIMLVGASIGAAATVVVASKSVPGVVAAVPLSAVIVADGRSIEGDADQLSLPTLFVIADQDGSAPSQAVADLHQRAPAAEKQLLVVPGTAHGWQLLDDAAVLEQVRAFLARYR